MEDYKKIQILQAGFLAALRWMYADSAKYVKDPNREFEENFDSSFKCDMRQAREAYALIQLEMNR